MNSLLPAWMKKLEDLKKMLPHRAHSDSLDRQRNADTSTFLSGSTDAKTKVLLTSQFGIPIGDNDMSPVFIDRVPPRSTTWLAGSHVETQTMLSMVLQGVRKSVLSVAASLAVQRLRLRARGRFDGTC